MKDALRVPAWEPPRHIFGWVAAAPARTVSGVVLAQPRGTVLLAAGARLAADAPRAVVMRTLNPRTLRRLLTHGRPTYHPPRVVARLA